MMYFLFDAKRQCLGEAEIQDGSLQHILLTKQGEERIGDEVSLWHTTGIPFFSSERDVLEDRRVRVSTNVKQVLPKQTSFEVAWCQWVEENGFTAVSLPVDRMPYWEQLLHVPCTDQERFAFLMALKWTPEKRLSEWQEMILETRSCIAKARTVSG